MRKVCVGFFVVFAIAARVNASPIVISDITGDWQNANPGANATIVNGSDQLAGLVRWGGTGSFSTDSGYSFDPTDNPVGYTLGTPFVLGEFTHSNQPIPSGSSITSIDYSFAFATNGVPASLSTVFNFDHNETPNSSPCPSPSATPCDDIVTISTVNLNSLILVGADQFYFNLLGFSIDGGATIGTEFFSPEGGSNTAALYGVLTDQPLQLGGEVPEPASLLLLGTGLTVLVRQLRKRSR